MTVEKFTIDDECSVTINVDLGEIIKISSPTHPKAVRLHIPSVSPDGTKIKYVRSHAFEGSFGTVSFDDNIQFLNGAFKDAFISTVIWPNNKSKIPSDCFKNSTIWSIEGIENVSMVESSAFEGANIEKLTWPSEASVIPYRCFKNCTIQDIDSIDNVSVVAAEAFAGSHIKHFTWPSKADRIPSSCFALSLLEEIDNIQNVTGIGDYAFAGTRLKSLDWPEAVTSIPAGCFNKSNIKKLTGCKNVVRIGRKAFAESLLEEIDELSSVQNIGRFAFASSRLSSLDLSSLTYVDIEKGAFCFISNEKIVKPYYTSDSMFDEAFQGVAEYWASSKKY